MYVFILQKKKFCCYYSHNSVKVLEREKRFWKILESPGIRIIFFGGNRD